jgi:hypothetical protein
MTEKLWIVLIVGVVVVLVVLILRRQLKKLALKGPGMEAEVETHGSDTADRKAAQPARKGGVRITDFKQTGSENVLDIGRGDVDVVRTKQKGTGQEIRVSPDQPHKE